MLQQIEQYLFFFVSYRIYRMDSVYVEEPSLRLFTSIRHSLSRICFVSLSIIIIVPRALVESSVWALYYMYLCRVILRYAKIGFFFWDCVSCVNIFTDLQMELRGFPFLIHDK